MSDSYRIALRKIRGSRSLPYWDTLSLDRAAATVTFSGAEERPLAVPARFSGEADVSAGGSASGSLDLGGESFGVELTLGPRLSGTVRWRRGGGDKSDPEEETEAAVQQDTGNRGD